MQYKWKALSVTAVGAMMSAIDSTVVLLALYPIAKDLNTDFITMIWVIIAYLLVNTALVLSLGRLGDMYGRKKMYNIGFVVFTVGSALCGLAFSGISLVGFRILQGAGAALITANSFAILSEAFPRNETGKAFGINSIVWSVGSVLGIVLGGVIITYTTWRLIFLINVPVGIFATVWAYLVLKAGDKPRAKETFDMPAALMFTAALSSILLGVTWGLIYGWTETATLGFFILAPIFLAGFVVWEQKFAKNPIVNFSLFRSRIFSFSILAGLLQSMAVFSVNFLLIFYLEGIAGLTILNASYLIIPLAAASAVFGPLGGLLSDKLGARVIASIGLTIAFFSIVFFTMLNVSTPTIYIAGIELMAGAGLGLFWPSNTSAIMSSLPPARLGVGSGIMNTFRNTGMIMSFAISLTAATSVIPAFIVYQLFVGNLAEKLSPSYAASYLSGQSFAFEISAALLILAIVFSALGSQSKTSKIQTPEIPEKQKTLAGVP